MARGTYHHGDLRRALLGAARRLIERTGPGGASLRAIAREAGVSAAAPYHHFDHRDAILAALAAEGFEELGEAMRRSAGRAAEGQLQRLQAAGVAYVRYAVNNPELFRLMFSGLLGDRGAYPELQHRAAAAFGVLQHLLGRPAGPPPGAVEPPVALTAWSTVHGLATLLIDGRLGERPSERRAARVARQVTEVLGSGLQAVASGAQSRED